MKRIGILLAKSINTWSLMESEFLIWNNIARNNENYDFVFILLSKAAKKSFEKNRHLLTCNYDSVDWSEEKNYHETFDKLDALFSYYMPGDATPIGELEDIFCKSYFLQSEFTNHYNKKLILRIADCEYKYNDYKLVYERRKENNVQYKSYFDNFINYHNVLYLANGDKELNEWASSLILKELKRIPSFNINEFDKNKIIYIDDDTCFNVRNKYRQLRDIRPKEDNKSLVFWGILKGTSAGKRIKVLDDIFGNKEDTIDVDLICPKIPVKHSIISKNINFVKKKDLTDNYYLTLRNYKASIFLAKGKPIKYFNKTLYDSIIAKIPILIYEPIDYNHAIFQDDKYYFMDYEGLVKLLVKLENPVERYAYIAEQKLAIFDKLDRNKKIKLDEYL